MIILLALENFGRHVNRRSHHGLGHFGGFELFAKSKISQFQLTVMKQDVCRFDISMQNLFLIQNSEGAHQLDKVRNGFNLIDHLVHLDLLFESASVAKFVHKVIMRGSLEHFNKPDNVWMVDICENAHFVVSQFGQFGNAFEFL